MELDGGWGVCERAPENEKKKYFDQLEDHSRRVSSK